jgi:hypothetical protein
MMNGEGESSSSGLPPDLNRLDLARCIDAVCRLFEADWRAGQRPAIADYLGEVPDQGRPALPAELVALEHELCRADETIGPSESQVPGPPNSGWAASALPAMEGPQRCNSGLAEAGSCGARGLGRASRTQLSVLWLYRHQVSAVIGYWPGVWRRCPRVGT